MTGTIRRILTTGLRVLGFCRSHPSANVRYNAAMDVLEELPYACSFPPTAATPNGGYPVGVVDPGPRAVIAVPAANLLPAQARCCWYWCRSQAARRS
jgi:hypothetical protein